MAKFEVGKRYYSRSACDYDCVFEVEIVSRTEKSVVVKGDANKRCKINIDNDGEYIVPEHYSMAPVYRAIREA